VCHFIVLLSPPFFVNLFLFHKFKQLLLKTKCPNHEYRHLVTSYWTVRTVHQGIRTTPCPDPISVRLLDSVCRPMIHRYIAKNAGCRRGGKTAAIYSFPQKDRHLSTRSGRFRTVEQWICGKTLVYTNIINEFVD